MDEVAKAVNGSLKQSPTGQLLNSVLYRLSKQASADTMLHNAARDGAEFAWVPVGDTCAFCITLASRGWQRATASLLNTHAEHIHAHCDCTFAVRHDKNSKVGGYDPDKYLEMYNSADGTSPKDKINSLRRIKYQENKDRINAQKREAYARKNINNRSILAIEKKNERPNQLTNDVGTSNIEYEKDILVPGSAGAKHKDTIVDLPDGTKSRLTPHTHIENVQIIAGKGRERQIEKVDVLAYKYPETADSPYEWQKLKGMGYVDYNEDSYRADLHWYRHPKTGNVDYKVKPDQGGNWFYED
ncbi:hypothetical protein [Butyrivibrio sp. JL13D10]|uniref:VG15 protein n=1 Tax=Butyrivibrio sp. JL13D10 TaxID=3236815 RepID=UPI0038B6A1B5